MYIITGGAGFIGSAVLWKLNGLGADNILVVDNLRHSEKWKNLVNRSFSRYMHRDDFLKQAMDGKFSEDITAIIHMGACSSTAETDADFLMRNNLDYSTALCEFALNRNIRFITASSAATYGDGAQGFDDDLGRLECLRPLNIYGYTKHLFDLQAKRRGYFERMVSLKFFNVYGPNEYHKEDMRSVAHKAFGSIRDTGGIRLFRSADPAYPDGEQQRDFIYVKDCAEIICWLLEHPTVNGLFNVGSGVARTWNALIGAVASAMNVSAAIYYVDMPDALKDKYQNRTEAPMSRLRAAGYSAPLRSLEEGVAEYVASYLTGTDPYL